MLNDADLLQNLTAPPEAEAEFRVEPWEPHQVAGGNALQPASIDLRLDRHFLVLGKGETPIDPSKDTADLFTRLDVKPSGEALVMEPGECILGSTYEKVYIGSTVAGHVRGKSSIGRLFLQVHCEAGLIDPGFCGHITLELTNLSPRPLLLYPGQYIAQLTVERLSAPAKTPYGRGTTGSHYQDQPRGPVLSRSHQRFVKGLPEDAPLARVVLA